MKILNLTQHKNLFVLMLCLAACISGCSDDDKKDPEPSLFDIQLKKMAHTWTATEVTLNGSDKTADYNSFVLTLAGEEGELAYTYAVSGRPAGSPWKAAGEWAFDFNGAVETQFQRDGGADAINIEYVVTETTLELTFAFAGDGYAAKVNDATGTWVFKFEK